MNFVLQPWQVLVTIVAGWINHEQQQLIEYLRTENQVLQEKLGKKRILLNDDQRRRLAAKGKVLGRKLLGGKSARCSRRTPSCAGIDCSSPKNGTTATNAPPWAGPRRTKQSAIWS